MILGTYKKNSGHFKYEIKKIKIKEILIAHLIHDDCPNKEEKHRATNERLFCMSKPICLGSIPSVRRTELLSFHLYTFVPFHEQQSIRHCVLFIFVFFHSIFF